MQRVRIEYADQNDSSKQMLPRRGTIVGYLREVHSQRPLTLVKLDEPFEWQKKSGSRSSSEPRASTISSYHLAGKGFRFLAPNLHLSLFTWLKLIRFRLRKPLTSTITF